MSIDYEKVEGFKSLESKEAKAALATYALDEFSTKLNKQKSFENMLADLEAAIPAEEVKTELLIDSPEPAIAVYPAVVEYTGEVVIDEPVIPDDGDLDVAAMREELTKVSILHGEEVEEELATALKAAVSAPDESSDEMAWLDGFVPTIILMGRNASSNGYYTCPWWIYDWISQNPEWYKNPDLCPHASAISTLKSLVYFVKRDGYVSIRETRNSRFVRIEF